MRRWLRENVVKKFDSLKLDQEQNIEGIYELIDMIVYVAIEKKKYKEEEISTYQIVTPFFHVVVEMGLRAADFYDPQLEKAPTEVCEIRVPKEDCRGHHRQATQKICRKGSVGPRKAPRRRLR